MSEKKRNQLFDILNIICTKEYTWETLPEEYKLAYSQFMINRFLSSYDYLMPLLDEVTTKHLTDEQHFTLLYTWVKHTKHYFNYNAYKAEKIDPDLLTALKKEYKINNREAERYNELLNDAQRKFLLDKWADYIKYIKSSI